MVPLFLHVSHEKGDWPKSKSLEGDAGPGLARPRDARAPVLSSHPSLSSPDLCGYTLILHTARLALGEQERSCPANPRGE